MRHRPIQLYNYYMGCLVEFYTKMSFNHVSLFPEQSTLGPGPDII
jgi:hypothetical protein